MNQGNIIGEEFEEYVFNQIDTRQSLNGAGSEGNPLTRDPKNLNYLNNRNAWVKMASGVSLIDPNPKPPTTSSKPIYRTKNAIVASKAPKITTGLDRLKSISGTLNGSIPEGELTKYNATGLAKNFVLFNTLSNLNFKNEENQEFSGYTFRKGIQTTQNNWLDVDSIYGLGGTAMGLQPTPGIIDVSVDCVNRGSIRKATVTLKAFNKFQFSIIEMLYLRLGYTMMLEWGWDRYAYKNEKDEIQYESMGNTLIENSWFKNLDTNNIPSQTSILASIENERLKHYGNYDGFFGKVNNFTWDFNPDGSYNITINLITLGDVVESLKVNINSPLLLPSNIKSNQENLDKLNIKEGSSIYNSLGTDILSRKLNQLVLDYKKTDPNNPLQKFSDLILNKKAETKVQTVSTSYGISTLPSYEIPAITTPPEMDYFLTLGDFLEMLQELVIPTQIISNDNQESLIEIDTDRNLNYINCYFNQIPLDPKICIFNTVWGKSFIENEEYNSLSDSRGLPLENLKGLPHQFSTYKEGFVAGKLMNLYLNVDFILKKLNSNIDKKGDLSLYKLVESICDGLNDALGNINNLEPIIKEDKILTIIDQNPIPRIDLFTSIPLTKEKKEVESKIKNPQLEVYGYNKGKSNFLKDIKFQTKIDNSLASMISIGATADGSSTKDYDATAFSKWNVGLKDRFSPPIIESSPTTLTATGEDLNKYLERAKVWANSGKNCRKTIDSKKVYWWFKNSNFYPQTSNYLVDGDVAFKLSYKFAPTKSKAIDAFLYHVKKLKLKEDKKTFQKAKLNEFVNNTYAVVLSDIFGRQLNIKLENQTFTQNVKASNYQELFTNDEMVKKLKGTFTSYLKTKSSKAYTDTNTPSGNIGFIPVSFDLTLEGMSGVKIYNKLNMDTRFLPSNYGESLDFLITKVNHKISSNSWDTMLGTISTSNIEKTISSEENSIKSNSRADVGITGEKDVPVVDYLPHDQGFNQVKNLIAAGESKGKYEIANNGVNKYKISTQSITDQKISFLLDVSSKRSKGSPNRTFAMGKYQIIPQTLENLVSYEQDKSGENYVGRNYTFDKANQEKLCNLLLLITRKDTGDYISGKNKGTQRDLEKALQQIGQEWASMPCIINQSGNIVGNIVEGTGQGAYYGGTGVNPSKSHVTLKQMAKALFYSRVQYSGKEPNYQPSYVVYYSK